MTLAVLAALHYEDVPDKISDGYFRSGHIIDVAMRVLSTLVVRILGFKTTHRITSGKMWMVERVLDGYPIAWASLMMVGVYEHLGR